MDLPPDKAKLLKGYDDEKKWAVVCDQVRNELWIYKYDVNQNYSMHNMISLLPLSITRY